MYYWSCLPDPNDSLAVQTGVFRCFIGTLGMLIVSGLLSRNGWVLSLLANTEVGLIWAVQEQGVFCFPCCWLHGKELFWWISDLRTLRSSVDFCVCFFPQTHREVLCWVYYRINLFRLFLPFPSFCFLSPDRWYKDRTLWSTRFFCTSNSFQFIFFRNRTGPWKEGF